MYSKRNLAVGYDSISRSLALAHLHSFSSPQQSSPANIFDPLMHILIQYCTVNKNFSTEMNKVPLISRIIVERAKLHAFRYNQTATTISREKIQKTSKCDEKVVVPTGQANDDDDDMEEMFTVGPGPNKDIEWGYGYFYFCDTISKLNFFRQYIYMKKCSGPTRGGGI